MPLFLSFVRVCRTATKRLWYTGINLYNKLLSPDLLSDMELHLFYAIPILANFGLLCGHGIKNGYGREARGHLVNILLTLNLCFLILFSALPQLHNVENFHWIGGWALTLSLTLAVPIFMETRQLHDERKTAEPQKKPKARKE